MRRVETIGFIRDKAHYTGFSSMNRVASSRNGRVYLPKYNTVPCPKLRLYLAILDRLRTNKDVRDEILHPDFANAYRNSKQGMLPRGKKTLVFPLGSAPFWQKLLDCEGNINKQRKPSAGSLARAVRSSITLL
jgi:hypothetical protein